MKYLKIIFYNLIIVFLIFLLMEAGFEYLMNHPRKIPISLLPSFQKYYMDYDRSIIQFDPKSARYDSDLYYRLKEGNTQFVNREFNTNYLINSLGVRDDESSLDYPKIIALGDSYAMGWGVQQDMTFSDLLEKKIHKKVLNAGVSSYGTAREMKLLQEIKTDSLQFLIIQYCSNDYHENKSFRKHQNIIPISDQASYESLCLDVEKKNKYYLFKHVIQIFSIIGNDLKEQNKNKSKPIDNEKNTEKPKQKKVDDIIAFLAPIIHAINRIPKNTKIIVFSTDDKKGIFIKELGEVLEMDDYIAYNERFILLDLSLHLDESNYFILDDHLNLSGHQVILDELIKKVFFNK